MSSVCAPPLQGPSHFHKHHAQPHSGEGETVFHQSWEGITRLAYKQQGSAPFRDITRQLLFRRPGLDCELRYFEIQPEGHSTLERHEHEHAVMILSGQGMCLIEHTLYRVAPFDLLHVPAHAWHQFRAICGQHLGFLCMVNTERDRPQLPDAQALAILRTDPEIAAFIRV